MNTNLTEIVFILDRSGSMSGYESDTIGGYNSFLEKQRADTEHETVVTTVLFDDKYEVLHSALPVHEILPLTNAEYYTRGSTALLDAVGRSVRSVGARLSKTPEDKRPGKVMFVITTDGYENASREFNRQQIRDMIRHQRDKYSWEFLFFGADIEAEEVAVDMGIKASNAYRFDKSAESFDEMYCCVSESVMNLKTTGAIVRDKKFGNPKRTRKDPPEVT